MSDTNNNYTVCLVPWPKKVFTQRLNRHCQMLSAGWFPMRNPVSQEHTHTHTHTANSIHCPPIMYHLDAGQWPSKSTPLGQGIKVFKTTPYGQKPSNGTVITDWHKRLSTVHMYGFWWAHVNMSEYSCVHVCTNQQPKSFFDCSHSPYLRLLLSKRKTIKMAPDNRQKEEIMCEQKKKYNS